MARSFPELIIDPASHQVDIVVGQRRLHGVVELQGDQSPVIFLSGEMPPPDTGTTGQHAVRAFPQEYDISVLEGRLWSGHDLVAVDAHVESGMSPGLTKIVCRYALVGSVNAIPEHQYEEVAVQITGLDLLFGRGPLKSIQYPRPSGTPRSNTFTGSFSAVADPESTQEWVDGDVTATCTYWYRSPSDPFHFEVSFAPVVSLRSATPLSIDEWTAHWVTPLLRMAAFVTRSPQRLSWLIASNPSPPGSERAWPRRAQLFASRVDQAPYQSTDTGAWYDPTRRPFLTLADTDLSLPFLLRQWESLDASDNPFVELYRQVMFHKDLPQRALYLYLVQALEALHSYEHRSADEAKTDRFGARRQEILAMLKNTLEGDNYTFVAKSWGKRPQESLEQRFHDLVGAFPSAAPRLRGLLATVIADDVRESRILEAMRRRKLTRDDAVSQLPPMTVEDAIRRVRNDLAHGSRNYDSRALRPWTLALDALCRAHMLRLLGAPSDVIDLPLAGQAEGRQ